MSDWDGKERRQMSQIDHDLLTRIDTKLTNFFDEFKVLKSKVAWHEKLIYLCMGGFLVIEFMVKFIK